MKTFPVLTITLLMALTVAGCTSSGAFLASNRTSVNLEEGNYTISATNVSGQAESGYLFGISYSYGPMANTLALARVEGDGMLYVTALEKLWENYASENGSITGRQLALTNVRYDADILNLFVYTKVKVTVRADVIEFN